MFSFSICRTTSRSKQARGDTILIDLSSDDENEPPPLFWKKWHVLKENKEFFKDSKKVAKVLLSPHSPVNSSIPIGCNESLAFIVDTSKLRFQKDLTCDENGKYKKPSTAKFELTVDDEQNIVGYSKMHDENNQDDDEKFQRFTLVRRYFIHEGTPSFRRTLYELHRNNVRSHPLVIIRYDWKGEKGQLKLTPHGNCKHSKEPFIRSKKEMIEDMKATEGTTAQKKINALYDRQGGFKELDAFSTVPRDRRQVYNHTSAKTSRISNFEKLLEMSMTGEFVQGFEVKKCLQKGPLPRCILYEPRQMEDVKKFCCNESRILQFDCTFDLGPMYMTMGCYRHPGFCNKSNGKSVLMPGPIMLHSTRDMDTYSYFGKQISLALRNQQVAFIGTDGETALYKGIMNSQSFGESKHLLCMLHHNRNIESKLEDLKIRTNARRIIRSIYGEQIDGTRYQGLADCQSDEEFDSQLAYWTSKWDELEREDTGREPCFSTWFLKYKSEEVKRKMLSPLREQAGLGSPPKQFTTNDCETINSMVSKWMKEKKTWDQLTQCLKDWVDSKYKELEMAVLGIGEYRLSVSKKHLQTTAHEWRHMEGPDREQHMMRVGLNSLEAPTVKKLSVKPEESEIGGYTLSQLQEVWRKAENILSTKGNIVDFPSKADQTMCFCSEGYHKVTKKETFVCDSNCRSYAFHQKLLCEHTLAVAEAKGVLADFIMKLNTRRRASNVSLVNPALSRQCEKSASGKKKTLERRGANNNIGTTIDRVVTIPTTNQPFTVARKIGLIKRCYGCKTNFKDNMCNVPHDIVLKKLDYREWIDPVSGQQQRSRTLVPTYYHLNMDCVRRNFPFTEINDILIHNEVAHMLDDRHKEKLNKFGIYW
nr:uncharacterized protein LOC129265580 [Lytechinus pictus]